MANPREILDVATPHYALYPLRGRRFVLGIDDLTALPPIDLTSPDQYAPDSMTCNPFLTNEGDV